jgi:hypothetical protein
MTASGLRPRFQVVHAVGVEGEVDLRYAGPHRLCRSMLDTITVPPQPQSDALRVAFGLSRAREHFMAADRPEEVAHELITFLNDLARRGQPVEPSAGRAEAVME